MFLTLTDYANPNKVVVAIADEEWREFVISGISRHSEVYDIYTDPDFLIPRLLEIPTFFRIMDYPAYKKVEADLVDYRDPEAIEGIISIIVYSVPKDSLIEHPCIIDGGRTHPTMVSQFFLSCHREARNL
ncbi:MAG: hypothetical protein JZU49_01315 [Sulfuricurvum sp.]|nr:hypothetical protein [Sulfuricurvum sp.]